MLEPIRWGRRQVVRAAQLEHTNQLRGNQVVFFVVQDCTFQSAAHLLPLLPRAVNSAQLACTPLAELVRVQTVLPVCISRTLEAIVARLVRPASLPLSGQLLAHPVRPAFTLLQLPRVALIVPSDCTRPHRLPRPAFNASPAHMERPLD